MAHNGFLTRLRKDSSGNVLAISAAAMIPLTIMVGSALDLSVSYMARGKLQTACDAGALAARQSMSGTTFDADVQIEGDRFFHFNFPSGTAGVNNASFVLQQDLINPAQLNGRASATVPTSLVKMIGVNSIDVAVDCNAMRETGYNDVMLVLDVTGSMAWAPSSGGGGTKIQRLRDGAMGLYRALQGDVSSKTRYGIVPYSHTVNVARSLRLTDIIADQKYVAGTWTYQLCDSNGYTYWNCVSKTSTTTPTFGMINGNTQYAYGGVFTPSGTKVVNIKDSSFGPSGSATLAMFRTSGKGCIEERATIDPTDPVTSGTIEIRDYVTQDDIDKRAKNALDADLQFGRYDPPVQNGHVQAGCPSEASRLMPYDTETDFQVAINKATANVTGGTYHDVGMVWGTRFISRNGFFAGTDYEAGDNASQFNGYPVNMHLVFMTDGILDTGDQLYSADGVDKYTQRMTGTGTLNDKHIARFVSACNRAKAMGVTVWVIALDTTASQEVQECATSAAHFYTSDGSDLENVFDQIGKGIGKLRLIK